MPDQPDTEAPPEGVTLGQVAYEAYYAFSGGKSLVSGDSLPGWSSIQDWEVVLAWECAADAVAQADRETRT